MKKGTLHDWLRFFRIVNLPTVPGDVLVGAAAIVAGRTAVPSPAILIAAACLASCALYLFGLADNDIVGAKTDMDRPIPEGRISLRSARVARGLCLFAALIIGSAANLPPLWWIVAFFLALAIVVYNRTKSTLLMGLCRGLNVLAGGAAVMTAFRHQWGTLSLLVVAAFWTLYIAAVTKCSEGEERDHARRSIVGLLIGALVYLQLAALVCFHLNSPTLVTRNLLLVGAGLLIALRVMKRTLPRVSAS